MRKRCLLHIILTSIFMLLFVLFLLFITSWQHSILKTSMKYPNGFPKQHSSEKLFSNDSKNSKETSQTTVQQYHTHFEGLDFEELLAKINITNGEVLQVGIIYDKQTKTQRVTLNNAKLIFPAPIDNSQTKVENSAKKYVYVHHHYNDQLSVNTRAFLSLCAQAGRTGRKVVRPYVKDTKLGSDEAWFPFETYYDEEHLNSLLASAGYASLVDKEEYLEECPPNSPDHVSIHFIDNSQSSMGFTKAAFRLQEEFYKAIVESTIRKGWTECTFLDKAMKLTPGKQFCVNAAIINDWKTLEKYITKHEKCLNVYLWRGIGLDGFSYRLKFNEENLKISSVDLTYALKPGQPVEKEVERFSEKYLRENYIALYVRSEYLLRMSSIDHLRKCVDLVLEVLMALKISSGLSRVYVATDMGNYGSGSLAQYRSKENLDKNFFKDIHDHIVGMSKGTAYNPPPGTLDRGTIALVDMTLASRAQYVLSVGTGTFQQWIGARFLQNHREDKRRWLKITVC